MAIYDVSTSEKKASPSLVAGGTLYADSPIGTILPFGGSTPPAGFMLCDGTAVSRTTYSELFAVIGESFGSGDGSTTFNLPDMRESVPKGAGLTGHTVGAHLDADGLAVGEFLDDQLQAHTHSNKTGSSTAGQEEWTMFATSRLESATKQTNNGVVGRFGTTTEVKSVGVNYIIKAKMIGVPADFLAKVDEAVEDVLDDMIPSGGKKILALKGYSTTDAVDLDTLKKTGVYSVTSQYASHLPDSSFLAWWQIIVINKSTTNTGYCSQVAMARNNAIYMRDCENDVWSSWKKLITESDLNKAITVTTPDNNIVIADSRLITDNLVMVSGYIKSGTQLAFNTSQVQIGKLSVSGRTIRGSGPCSLFLYSNDLFGTNGPNTIPAIWKTAQGWLTIGINVTNNPRLHEDSWFTVMLPLE